MDFFDILLARQLNGGGGGGGQSAVLEEGEFEFTQNTSSDGEVLTPSEGNDGFSQVTVKVNVPQPSGSLPITENNTYDVTQYAEVAVAVPQPVLSGYVLHRVNSANGLMNALYEVETWGMTSTGDRDFWNMGTGKGPTKIYYRNGIQTITDFSAANCPDLSYIYLGNTITSIDSKAFGKAVATYKDIISTVEIEPGFNCDLHLDYCHALTLESVRAIIQNFAPNSNKTLTLSSPVFALLDYADIANAVAKGLTIADSGIDYTS